MGQTIRRLLAVLAFAVLATSAWAAPPFYTSGKTGLSITQSNRTVTFTDNHSGGTNAAFLARVIMVRSDSTSANTCMVDLVDGTATASDVPLPPGATIVLTYPLIYAPSDGIAAIGAICSTGQTATFYVEAYR